MPVPDAAVAEKNRNLDRLRLKILRSLEPYMHAANRQDPDWGTTFAEKAQQVIVAANVKMKNADSLIDGLREELAMYGPICDLVYDEAVSEIMVVGPKKIYVEVKGKIGRLERQFGSEGELQDVVRTIAESLGRRIDDNIAMVDARLPDGSRVNAVVPPLAVDGSMLTIRKFSLSIKTAADFVAQGSASENMIRLLDVAVKARLNIVVVGSTGSGKTTLLNLLSTFIPEDERILTIEDTAELQLPQEHVGRLEARPADIHGRDPVTIADLFRNTLRMRPDRIVVGECRGPEAFTMLQAMNTGHDGSLTTIHANSPRDAVDRIENMCLMAGYSIPPAVFRRQIASAIELLVQVKRFSDGSRKIESITEITGMIGEIVSLSVCFKVVVKGRSSMGKVEGQ